MGKSKSPAFQFYPDAWLSSTDIQLMSPAEEGAFLRLLCHAWLQPDCGLPDDDSALAVLSRLGTKWRTSSERIRRKFVSRDGRLYNERLSEERTKQDEWRAKSKAGGDKSAETRWGPKNKGGYQMVNDSEKPNGNSSSSSSSSSSLPPSVVVEAPPPPPPRKPDFEAFRDTDPDAPITETANKLCGLHAAAGLYSGTAVDAATEIGKQVMGAANLAGELAAMVAAHPAFVPHWQQRKQRDPSARLPTVAMWIRDGTYRHPPASAPQGQPGAKKRLRGIDALNHLIEQEKLKNATN